MQRAWGAWLEVKSNVALFKFLVESPNRPQLSKPQSKTLLTFCFGTCWVRALGFGAWIIPQTSRLLPVILFCCLAPLWVERVVAAPPWAVPLWGISPYFSSPRHYDYGQGVAFQSDGGDGGGLGGDGGEGGGDGRGEYDEKYAYGPSSSSGDGTKKKWHKVEEAETVIRSAAPQTWCDSWHGTPCWLYLCCKRSCWWSRGPLDYIVEGPNAATFGSSAGSGSRFPSPLCVPFFCLHP